jgi:ATP-dependent RNA helicase DeaD
MINDFTLLGINSNIVELLGKNGIKEPTPIQEQVIPEVFKGKDIIAQSQTGTGKTLAFVLPMIQRINVESSDIQGLIVTPTRELAIQITSELKKFGNPLGINTLAAYGGQDVERQIRKISGKAHIVVGTPGRLIDHLRRRTVNFKNVTILVLDEADVMLQMGFMMELEQVISDTPSKRQTLLFSATMPKGIRSISNQYMKNISEIRVKGRTVTLDEIEQFVVETNETAKEQVLMDLLNKYNPFLAIIFCKTKRRAELLNTQLVMKGYKSDELHGDISQSKREKVMKSFRDAKLQFLVATDIAARGLDVEGVSHIFSYDVPEDAESYIHRIGRTGRAGDTGIAITLCTPGDKYYLDIIEKGINKKIKKVSMQDGELVEKRAVSDKFTPLRGDVTRRPRASVSKASSPGKRTGTGEFSAKPKRKGPSNDATKSRYKKFGKRTSGK